MKCPTCSKGTLKQVTDIVHDISGHHFVTKGQRCTSCGEEFTSEKDFEPVIKAAKKLGIWGEPLKLHRKLSRSGRGTVLRIPTDLESNLKLKGNERVLISKVGKRKFLVEIEE